MINLDKLLQLRLFLDSIKQSSITPKELEELQVKRPPSEFSDGPPCLESLTREKLNDTRDRVDVSIYNICKEEVAR